jgi:outer membrane protein OmpA-like peptidoglycan-associated protein
MQLGLSKDRISALGHANTVPIAANSTEVGRKKNRRATFELKEK